MTWTKDDYTISTDKEKIDVDYVHSVLSGTYWAEEIPRSFVERSIEGAMCFGVYHNERQVGFARMITDKATFGYLADVFIDETYRGRGLSKWLMEVIFNHPDLQNIRRFMLGTRDAHGLYRQFGFTELALPDRFMERAIPGIYKKMKQSQ
ncbi:GNAT family N-acetyltransferase [Pseudoflavitalea sp. G-6-1-2]|uniref:GNAT family N-acetyltransferase n=1 Tax=Pseudoflavitalea sp. G-6-1-2 TaxID=2728841 RepID=UPI00146E2B3A|nr:GNAT family N-acetyltransferase [Pseudoflavitalea sp. G-6-1-2]NML20382.1 GNAT family N-acetyltransferase [Pseudoflavitalea sp. G-6-1-2]